MVVKAGVTRCHLVSVTTGPNIQAELHTGRLSETKMQLPPSERF